MRIAGVQEQVTTYSLKFQTGSTRGIKSTRHVKKYIANMHQHYCVCTERSTAAAMSNASILLMNVSQCDTMLW